MSERNAEQSDDTTVHDAVEVEVSVHHCTHEYLGDDREYEVHTGFSDVLRVDKRLARDVKEATGLDLINDEYKTDGVIEIVNGDEVIRRVE
jgi:hypothetical protein